MSDALLSSLRHNDANQVSFASPMSGRVTPQALESPVTLDHQRNDDSITSYHNSVQCTPVAVNDVHVSYADRNPFALPPALTSPYKNNADPKRFVKLLRDLL